MEESIEINALWPDAHVQQYIWWKIGFSLMTMLCEMQYVSLTKQTK